MKVVIDKRIPGLEEGIERIADSMTVNDVSAEGILCVAREGAEITAEDVRDADMLFVRTRTRCDAELLQGSTVKLVGTATIGTDHIDIPWCEANGINVVNAPGCNAPAVMQYVAASLHEAGFDPASDTLGVVGKGHIGTLVTELYRSAGTEVLVCDPPRKDRGDSDDEYLPLEFLLENCDAVTFHVPYTTAVHPTRHMLSHGLLSRFKRPRILVNVSRGGVFNPDVLDLDRRFVIDTWPFEDEPDVWPETRRRCLLEKAFIATPHIAGYSVEGKRRATEAMLTAFYGFLEGKLLIPNDTGVALLPPLDKVIASFDPLPLSLALKSDPSSFEHLRGNHLRQEPSPIIFI